MSDFVFPPSPAVDETTVGPYGEVYNWDGVKWSLVAGGAGGGGAGVEVGATPPANPSQGSLWWDLVSVKLYMWDGGQWVVVSNVPEGGGSGASGPPFQGVTDGSNAAPGMIGETIASVIIAAAGVSLSTAQAAFITTLDLTAGDWDVYGEAWLYGGGGAGTSFTGWQASIVIGSVALIPNAPATSGSRTDFRISFTASNSNPTTLALKPCRVSSSTPQSCSLVISAAFATGNATGAGIIIARRMR